MPTTISNDDELVNARDVIARIEELKKIQQEHEAELATLKRSASHDANTRIETLKESKQDIEAELETLESLAEEVGVYDTEWEKDSVLIRDSYFKEYAQEQAKGTTPLPDEVSWDEWPLSCIDWERVARQLKTDYSPIEFDGVTYWVIE